MTYYGNKKVVAQFVGDLLMDSRLTLASITVITQGSSEDCSVRIVTDTSLEDIVSAMAAIYSVALLSTSPKNTQAG